MIITLPVALQSFVDEQVMQRGYAGRSDYVCDLVRRDAERHRLRGLLLQGAASVPAAPAGDEYFADLRARVRNGHHR
jgi:antitoxin ParD1/3/4